MLGSNLGRKKAVPGSGAPDLLHQKRSHIHPRVRDVQALQTAAARGQQQPALQGWRTCRGGCLVMSPGPGPSGA